MKRIWTIILLAIVIQACKKNPGFDPTPVTGDPPNTVSLDIAHPANTISPQFQGFSFETWLLCRNPGYLDANNAVLIQLLKNLGTGVLRIGGNSSDETGWTGKPRTVNTSADSLTTSEIDRLAAFSRATGWPVIFGLNLGTGNVAAATDEAIYTYNDLNQNLLDFQVGNEPDYYKLGYRQKNYSVLDYQQEWNTYHTAIKAVLPNAPFAGPDISDNEQWVNTFASDNGSNVNLLDAHYYVSGPATDTSIHVSTILDGDSDLPDYLQNINAAALQAGLGYRITEANSIWGGGKAGVSDTFASALWALDLMWTIAENNGQGINFHSGDGLVYSPFSNANGIWTANPEYYAMLAFQYGAAGGRIIPLTTSDLGSNCSAYACVKENGAYVVTLINKEKAQDIYFTLRPGITVSHITVNRLSAPSMISKTGVVFAGSTVGSDGTFVPGDPEQISINKQGIVIKVPMGSAAIVTMH
jgi:hypothetical protein